VQLSVPYRQRLNLAWQNLFNWILTSGRTVSNHLNSEEADRLLADYIQHCYANCVPYDTAVHAVLSLQNRFPQFKRALPHAWQLAKAWKAQLPFSMRTPLPQEWLLPLVTMSFAHAFSAAGCVCRDWFSLGLLLWLGFECLLRPAEVCKLTRQCLLLPSQTVGGIFRGVVAIKQPKNSQFFGRQQFAVTDCKELILWLEWFVVGLVPEAVLFPGGAPKFNKLFRQLCDSLHLGKHNLTLGCLRPGTATALFSQGHTADRIRFMGRWANLSTLEHYIQEGMSISVGMSLSRKAMRKLKRLKELLPVLASAPPFPWHSYFQRHHRQRNGALA
jgi:hypothetical protein